MARESSTCISSSVPCVVAIRCDDKCGEPGAGQFQPGGDLLTRSSGQERHGQQSYLLWLRTANLRLNIQAAIEQFLVHHFGGWRRALMLARAAAGQIAIMGMWPSIPC